MKTGTERLKVMVNSRETLHLFTLGHQQRLCVWFDEVLCAVGVVEQQLCFCGSGRPAGASAGQTRGWEHSRSVAGWTPAAVPPERIRDLPAVSAQPELQLPELPDSVNGLDLTHFLFKYPKPVKSTEWSSVWISQECCMEFSLGVWVMWYWRVCVWWRVEAFDAGFSRMDDVQRRTVVSHFIVPFLSRAGTGQMLLCVCCSSVRVRSAHQ